MPKSTSRIPRQLIIATPIVLGIWSLLAVVGAFLGIQRAAQLFNSPPLAVSWILLTGLLIVGFFVFSSLRRDWVIAATHLGCILVIVGGLWGSAAAHRLRTKITGKKKIYQGRLIIREGEAENRVTSPEGQLIGQLPFLLYLRDFEILYYPGRIQPQLRVKLPDGTHQDMPVKTDHILDLGKLGKIRILQTFRNFQIDLKKGQPRDVPGPARNPAVKIAYTPTDSDQSKAEKELYVFERFSGHAHPGIPLHFTYQYQLPGPVKDYFNDLTIVKEGRSIDRYLLEVNGPLHFGGYYFYPYSYDMEQGKYTILSVASDSGLGLVYAGYLCLGFGIFRLCFRRISLRLRSDAEPT